MERLTYEKSRSRWDEGRFPTKYTSRHTFQEVVARLAAYEDTGLGPEEIKTILERYRAFRSSISDETGQPMVSWTRAGEICRAEKDGRLVVLPCKVRDILFAADDAPVIPVAVTDIGIVLDGPAGEDWESVGNIGKTVFLTREEAEAALKKRGRRRAMRLIDAEPSEGGVKLHSAIHGDGTYETFKRIASEFYTNHTYKFVALTLDGEPRPDIVTFTSEFWRAPDGAEAPPPNDPLTLEELREMDGEPVWVTKAGYQSRWALVFVFSKRENIIRLTFDNGSQPIAKTLLDGCKIYRRKPEEG